MTIVQFIHLDDQPENVSWIPRQMVSWLWQEHRARLADYPFIEESDDETTFVIETEVAGRKLKILYDIVENTEAFWAKLAAIKDVQGVVLDQWVGEDQHAGSNTYMRLAREQPKLAERVLLLTAYPRETCVELNWTLPHEQLQTKPPVQAAVIGWLAQHGLQDVLRV